MNKMKISIIGLGFVGNAIFQSLNDKIKIMDLHNKIEIYGYDKYKNSGIGKLDDCLDSDIIFLALPTLYNEKLKSYEYDCIYDTCILLEEKKYNGVIVIKSTVEPTLTNSLSKKYKLHFIHNPEFLTARTAYDDFHNQQHIVIGKGETCPMEKINVLKELYKLLYPNAEISECDSTESESMKIYCNTFYAVKIQYFNELYLLCQKLGTDYDRILELMIKNKWINPMHTKIPGPDGKLSYGGLCFPKDTNALLQYMKNLNTPHEVLEATIRERNIFRNDHENCT